MTRSSLARIIARHKSAAPTKDFWKLKKDQLRGVMSMKTTGLDFVSMSNYITSGLGGIVNELLTLNSRTGQDAKVQGVLNRIQTASQFVSKSMLEYQTVFSPLNSSYPGQAGVVIDLLREDLSQHIREELPTLGDVWERRFELAHLKVVFKHLYKALLGLDPALLKRVGKSTLPKIMAEVLKTPSEQWESTDLAGFRKDWNQWRSNPWGDPAALLAEVEKVWPPEAIVFPFSSMTDAEVFLLLWERDSRSDWLSESRIIAMEGYGNSDGPLLSKKQMDKVVEGYLDRVVKAEMIRLRALPLEKQKDMVIQFQRERLPSLEKILKRIGYYA